ncbi:hypothetical protein SteCoe_10894 [Stentor coeruleus]|uniref:Uncharacterized protein n=1 Tax=Stentor coeruleus TaxID=5963 RepID=A0A1R2CED3_9CILI|nr:hypothetical protein SteCoe_10894 [Stentor coeruleus]
MKRDQKLTRFRRLSASPKSNLPPLTPNSYMCNEKTHIHPYAAYPIIEDQEKSTCQKFFIKQPPRTAQSPNTENTTTLSLPTNYDFYTPIKTLDHSDITERIESYELRIKKIFSIDALEDNLLLWEKCLDDIMPEVKKHDSDLRRGLVQICMHLLENSKNILKCSASRRSADELAVEALKKVIASLEIESKKLQSDIESMKYSKKLEMGQIEKDLEEIFGKNENEIRYLKSRTKELRDTYSQDTVDFLWEIWNSMNQEFDVPEIKNGDFIGLDPSDIPLMLSKKFTLLQKFTAKRISDLIRSKKNIEDNYTQTTGEYIDPKTFEDQTKNIEKLRFQLNSAFISIDRYKENFGSKVNIVEALENTKNLLSNEVEKLRSEIELMSSTLNKANYDSKKLTSEFENIKKEKDYLQKEKNSWQLETIEKNKQLEEQQISIEKLIKLIEDKEQKIIILENRLGKRRGIQDNNEEGLDSLSSQFKAQNKFDEKSFLDSLKLSNKKRRSLDKSQAPSYTTNEGNSYDFSGYEDPLNSSSSIQNSIANAKSGTRSNSPPKGRVLKKLGLIEENSSSMSLSNQEAGHIGYKNPRQNFKDKGIKLGLKKQILGQNVHKNAKNKPNTRNAENATNGLDYESLDEFETNIKHEDYIGDNAYDGDSQSSYAHEKRTYSGNMSTKSTSTDEFTYIKCIEYSKGFQFNGIVPDEKESEDSNKDGVYLLPYNPNQFYGLKGDVYYQTKNSVFSAYPRIPDLKDNFTFQSLYVMKK